MQQVHRQQYSFMVSSIHSYSLWTDETLYVFGVMDQGARQVPVLVYLVEHT